jgi:hypothetical protein
MPHKTQQSPETTHRVGENIADYKFDMVLISKIYEELLRHNNKRQAKS